MVTAFTIPTALLCNKPTAFTILTVQLLHKNTFSICLTAQPWIHYCFRYKTAPVRTQYRNRMTTLTQLVLPKGTRFTEHFPCDAWQNISNRPLSLHRSPGAKISTTDAVSMQQNMYNSLTKLFKNSSVRISFFVFSEFLPNFRWLL